MNIEHTGDAAACAPSPMCTCTPGDLLSGSTERERARVRVVSAALAAGHDLRWVPGTTHPGGGYDRVVLNECENVVSWMSSCGGLTHRDAGPAALMTALPWADLDTLYYRRGVQHRGDGPSMLSSGHGLYDGPMYQRYHYEGVMVDLASGLVAERTGELLAAGAARESVVGWLVFDHAQALALVRAGGDVTACRAMAAAGAADAELLAAAAGELPVSWAVAGLDRP